MKTNKTIKEKTTNTIKVFISEKEFEEWKKYKNNNNNKKYTPSTKEELKSLVDNHSIYLGDIDVSSIEDMSHIFKNSTRKDFSGIEDWNIGKVENMSYMFHIAKYFNEDISKWNVRNVTNMRGMFKGASSFNQDISKWDVSAVQSMSSMFYGATSFKKNISEWNLISIKDMSYMFKACSIPEANKPKIMKYAPKTKEKLIKLIKDLSINLGDIDVSNITDMSHLFAYSTRKDFSGIEKWNVSKVKNMSYMFLFAHSFNQDISSWDVSKVKNMKGMFYEVFSFNQPLDKWDVSNVTNMAFMFDCSKSFNQPLVNWNVSNVTNMESMFNGAKSFNQPLDKWDVSSVTNMTGMFRGAMFFNQDISNWDVSNVKNMNDMFAFAESFNQDISKWNVRKVTDMSGIFAYAKSFNQNVSKWDIRKTKRMVSVFFNCPISEPNKFKTINKPTNLRELKELIKHESVSLKEIDISSIISTKELFKDSKRKDFSGIETWDISKVKYMDSMFENAIHFNHDISNWDVSNAINVRDMFKNCPILEKNKPKNFPKNS